MAADRSKPIEDIYVDSVWRTNFESQAEILYAITLKSRGHGPYSFSKVAVDWHYDYGVLDSIGLGDILIPRATYIVDLPLNIDDTDTWDQTTQASLQPPIVVPSGTTMEPGTITFELQLHYSFVGEEDYHPKYDWDIVFDVALIEDESGTLVKVVPQSSWRAHPGGESRPGWGSQSDGGWS